MKQLRNKLIFAVMLGALSTAFASDDNEMLMRAPDPRAHYSRFPVKTPVVGIRGYHQAITVLATWLNETVEGKMFLEEILQNKLPSTLRELNGNLADRYKLWYVQTYEIPMAIEVSARTIRGEVQQELGGELVEARQALFDAESRSASQVMAYEQELGSMREALERQAAEIHRLTTAMQALEVDNTILKATVQPPRYASASRARTVGQPPITEEESQFRMQSPLKRMALSAVDDKDIGLE